jgi:hypothetical protein
VVGYGSLVEPFKSKVRERRREGQKGISRRTVTASFSRKKQKEKGFYRKNLNMIFLSILGFKTETNGPNLG